MKKILFAALALIVVMASCVKDPQYPGVTISDVKYAPTAVQADDDVTVTATITSFNDFTAKLYYTAGEAETAALPMVAGENNVYSAVIPGQADGVAVSFYIVAEGTLVATSPAMEYVVGAVAIDYSVLRLNELNGNKFDEENLNGKFIEIYNTGNEPVNMKGVYIEKDGEQNWVGDNTITVEPGGFLVLYSEDIAANHEDLDSIYFFHSGLSNKKNVRIQMFTPAGESIDDFNLTNIDLNGEAYGTIEAPASYSLNSDGNWYYAAATPGAENVEGENPVLGLEGGVEPPTPVEPDFANLVLNELNGDTKFIEFYNKGDQDLSMEGMYIMKDDYVAGATWTGDANVVIPAHGYVLLYSEDVTGEGGAQAGYAENLTFHSGLSGKKTVRITLFMPDGTVRDEYTRGSTGEWGQSISNVGAQSFARTPDGGDWKLADPTPGAANPETGEDIPQE
jgi:hypothetical protein